VVCKREYRASSPLTPNCALRPHGVRPQDFPETDGYLIFVEGTASQDCHHYSSYFGPTFISYPTQFKILLLTCEKKTKLRTRYVYQIARRLELPFRFLRKAFRTMASTTCHRNERPCYAIAPIWPTSLEMPKTAPTGGASLMTAAPYAHRREVERASSIFYRCVYMTRPSDHEPLPKSSKQP